MLPCHLSRDSNKGKPGGQTRQRKQRHVAALPFSSSLVTWAHLPVLYVHDAHMLSVQVNECTGKPGCIPLFRFLFYCLEMGLSLNWKLATPSGQGGHKDMPPRLAFLCGD